jgi:hypothetical protein
MLSDDGGEGHEERLPMRNMQLIVILKVATSLQLYQAAPIRY